MCEPYYDEDDEGRRTISMDVKDKKVLSQIAVGNRASFKVQGDVTEVRAHRVVRDYSKDWNGKGKRPMKELPGKVLIKMDKGDPDIAVINAHLMDEED